ncbi:MAG: glycoside hydrolase family 9 protein, partial [Mariprofundaceae bacterium]|nr:glycoside hydrolase family 9 protein [Mariprofundaceae bacterium]
MAAQAVVDRILYDDYANVSFSMLDYSSESSVSPYQGTHCLLIQPDIWHNPFLRIATGRTDFRPYDVIEFFIRSPYAQIYPQFVTWDYGMSNTVHVDQYTQGGVVDSTWRKVSIPIKTLISPTFAMDSVLVMQFWHMPNPYPFYIDNIVLRSTSTPVLTGSETRSDRAVTLKFEDFSIPLTQAGIYTIRSPDDVNYQLAQRPISVGIDRQAIGTPDAVAGRNPKNSINESRLHLLLPFPMQVGKHYHINYRAVRRDNGFYPASANTVVIYDPSVINGSVQVNQVGYMPAALKRAFVGNWLGTAGAMPIDHYSFQLVDAYSQTAVYQGTLTARALNDKWSGNSVYIADFSAFTQVGRYYLDVPGIGRSYSFNIQPDVFESVYRTTMRVLYHKRNSALVAPYVDAGRERAGGVPAYLDGIFHPDMYASPLYNGEPANQYHKIEAGWFDAGDLGEYITNQALIWSLISDAFDLASPNSFQDGELNIPESSNGIPDILDELTWGSRWAL